MTDLLFPSLPTTPAAPRRANAAARERRLTPRRGLDWFRTPAWATEALLMRETFPGAVWECAAGDGAMADPIAAAGYRVVATDIEPRGRPDVLAADFLVTTALPAGVESIVTNPPFISGGAFVRHALALGARKIAIIQRLAFLEGAERLREIFAPAPPARVWVFARRVTMWAGDAEQPEGEPTGGAMAFAWIVWEAGQHDTRLGWIE